jgi:hypothetical protein
MGTQKPKVGIGVRLSVPTMFLLDRLCKQEGVSKAEVIREGVDREIVRRRRARLKAMTQ